MICRKEGAPIELSDRAYVVRRAGAAIEIWRAFVLMKVHSDTDALTGNMINVAGTVSNSGRASRPR